MTDNYDAVSHMHVAPLPAGAQPLCAWVLTTGTQLYDLRAALHRILAAHQAGSDIHYSDVVDRIALAATELVTNAIRHCLPPTQV